MFKILNNEDGFAIVIALMILALLTIIGVSGIRTSMTEVQIAGNSQVMWMNFYGADGGVDGMGPVWLKGKDEDGHPNLPKSEYTNVDWLGTTEYTHGNNVHVTVEMTHVTKVDPSDGVTKVLLYGDEDGDYLYEDNFTVGTPYARVQATGTHLFKGGQSKLERTYKFQPIFADPGAAVRVNSSVSGNGVAGSIIGEHRTGSSCPDMPDIMYDVLGGTIDYSGDMGDNPLISQSTGMYPMPLVKEAILKNSQTQIIVPSGPQVDPGDIVSDADNPAIVMIQGSTKITNMTGYGILFIDGDYECGGNLDWNGLILVSGNITLSGGGTKTVYGSIVASGEAVAINGSVDVQADCDLLNNLWDNFSYYVPLPTWRYVRG